MNKPTTERAIAFIAKGAAYLGTVKGYDFYESPTYGDESPLLVITPEGLVMRTDEWEVPSAQDFDPAYLVANQI